MVRVGGVVVVLAIVSVLLTWLLLDVFNAPEPHGVPVALVGEGPPVAGIVGKLERDGVFDVKRAKSGAAARKLIAEREVYGAYAPRAGSGRLLVAGAASPAVGRPPAHLGARDRCRARRQDGADRHPPAAR